MTKTTGKRNHGPVLVAALTVLGASLGISTPAGAASDTTGLFLKGHDTTTTRQGKVDSFTVKQKALTTSTQIKGETSSKQFKFWAPASTQIKGETTSTQHKGQAPSAMFLKHNTGSTQIKGEAPSAKFLKLDATKSTQIKGETHSNQIKLNSTGGSQTH